ncbi:MAG TPA: PQQ-binding-like beta-propeller repeat protein [Gaiellaceae bacterium]
MALVRFVGVAIATVALAAACDRGSSTAPTTTAAKTEPTTTEEPPSPGEGWTRFGYDAARSSVFPGDTGITAENVGDLKRRQVRLPGTADSSAVFVPPDLFILTTSYGKAVGVDADSGEISWTFVPEGIEGWEGTSQITQSSPVVDPAKGFVYTYSPDGRVHKLRLEDGHEIRAEEWPALVTRDPVHEKSAPPLNLSRGLVLLATGGYFGDAPPYQGHVVAIDADSGRLVNVFNTLCSNREGLLDPSSCPESGSAIWGRGGVVVVPGSGNLLVSTGNADWNGSTNWGDSMLELSPDAGKLVGSYTPENEADLDAGDRDLASASPAFVPPNYAVQGGKDGILRVLDLTKLGLGKKGGETSVARAPGDTGVFTAPAVYEGSSGTWVFVANSAGTAGYLFRDAKLDQQWQNGAPGTSPVLAGGLLYVYDPSGGGLNVYDPESGQRVANLPAGAGHWSSPIVIDGRIALPQGNSNDHTTEGILNVYSLP